MSRNRSDCRAHDCRHIDLHSDYDVRYWTMRFGVTESQLRSAVDITGVVADEVERFLTQWRSRRRRPSNAIAKRIDDPQLPSVHSERRFNGQLDLRSLERLETRASLDAKHLCGPSRLIVARQFTLAASRGFDLGKPTAMAWMRQSMPKKRRRRSAKSTVKKNMAKSANSLKLSHHSIASFDTGDAIELHGSTSQRTRISISAQIDLLRAFIPDAPIHFHESKPMREQRSNSDKDLTERGKESVKLDQERTDSRDHAKQSGKDEAEKEAVTSTANQQKK